MDRRNFIIGAGGVGAATIGGIALFTGGAAAETDGTFTANDISGESDDGSIDDILVDVTEIEFSYEGLDAPAEKATISLHAEDEDGDREQIGDAVTRDDISGTSGSFGTDDIEGASLLDHSGLEASDFEEDEDGETQKKDVSLILEVEVEYGDDSVSGESEDDLAVAMENIEAEAEVDGDANGEIQSFEPLGSNEDGTFDVGVNYGNDVVSFHVSITHDGWPNSSEAGNFNLNFVVEDEAPAEDFQIGWHASGEGDAKPGGFVKEANDEGERKTTHVDEFENDDVTVRSDESGDYSFVVETDRLPADGESYEWAAAALDGGEGTSLFITADGEGVDWSDADNFIYAQVNE